MAEQTDTKQDATDTQGQSIAVGDTVMLRWTTPGGKLKRARGRVVALHPKHGVQVNYLDIGSERGGGFSMTSRTVWKPLACARKVEPKEGDKLTPSDVIGRTVRAMAGLDPNG